MAKWCLLLDKALNDNDSYNQGCTDKWGAHHSCKGCPHNKYMGDNSNCLTNENYGNNYK